MKIAFSKHAVCRSSPNQPHKNPIPHMIVPNTYIGTSSGRVFVVMGVSKTSRVCVFSREIQKSEFKGDSKVRILKGDSRGILKGDSLRNDRNLKTSEP